MPGVNEGGQCNSSTSFFSVDVTPPLEGQVRAGPFYDMVSCNHQDAKVNDRTLLESLRKNVSYDEGDNFILQQGKDK